MLTARDLSPGRRFERAGPPMVQAAFNDFGALLGTDAPIHVDPDYGARTVYGGTIAQGMLLLAPVETWLCDLFGREAWHGSGGLKATMLSPARAGERGAMVLTVRSVAAGRATLDLSISRADTLLIAGEVSITLP